jgi:hypothetical protein
MISRYSWGSYRRVRRTTGEEGQWGRMTKEIIATSPQVLRELGYTDVRSYLLIKLIDQ